jgi:dihydroorotase
VEDGEKILTDSNGFTRVAKEVIKPVKTIIGGAIYDNEL